MGNEEKNILDQKPEPEQSFETTSRHFEGKKGGIAHEKRPVMALDILGEAKIRNEHKYHESIAKFIPELNSNAGAISEELRADIKSVLPPEVDVEVSVSFYPGSIDLAAIVTVIGTASAVLEVISLSKHVVSAARFSVRRILGKQVGSKYPIRKITTKVNRKKFSDPVHPLTRFLWWCSGGSKEILRASPTEAAKYVGIGGAVLTTGVLASLTGGYAVYTMFEWSKVALLVAPVFGLLWGGIIFSLDRYIVSTLKKLEWRGQYRALASEYGPALVRLALAVFIGIAIAKPLELALFHPEVSSRIQFNKDKDVGERGKELDALNASQVNKLTTDEQRIQQEDEEAKNRIAALSNEFSKEMDGTGGSRKVGYHVVAKRKERLYLDAKKEYEDWTQQTAQPRLREIASERDSLERRKREILEEYARTLEIGFLRRIKALSDLTQTEWSVWLANIFIIGLLILIEVLPVLVKVIAPYGPYDAKLNLKEDADISKAKYRKDSLVEIIKNHFVLLTRAEKEVDERFFEESVGARGRKIGEGYANWVNSAFDGKGETFEEFLSSTEENIFLNRKP